MKAVWGCVGLVALGIFGGFAAAMLDIPVWAIILILLLIAILSKLDNLKT